MESPLLRNEQNRLALRQKIHQLCDASEKALQKQGDYKQTKSFFISDANHFIENLIHLHSKEVNLFIKTHLKKVMQLIHEDKLQQISNTLVFHDLTEYSKQKNPSKQAVFDKLQKLFNYFLFKECSHRSKMEVQNVQLQIQCALNYTCPICIKQGEHYGPYSLKNIDNQVHSPKLFECREPKTMRQIQYDETKENDFSHNIKTEKPLLFKLKQTDKATQSLKKQWNTFGDLMGLEKFKFAKQPSTQSNQSKSERLYKELLMRNHHNQRAIRHFNKKGPGIEKKQLSKSLYVPNTPKCNLEESQKVVPIHYFNRKKVHSVGQSNLIEHNSSQMKPGISDRKKSILKPLASLHHTVQFDKSFNLQGLTQHQKQKQVILTNRKIQFQLNSSCLSNGRGRVLISQHDHSHKKGEKIQTKITTKEVLPNLYEV